MQKKIASQISSYAKEVDRLSSEFIFRNPKASQTEVAKTLGVPTSHIVYLFKYHSNTSFSEYRMQSRINVLGLVSGLILLVGVGCSAMGVWVVLGVGSWQPAITKEWATTTA